MTDRNDTPRASPWRLGLSFTPATGDVDMTVSESLRAAIREAMRQGTTRYRIAQDADVDHSGLSRFLDEGRDIRVSTVDALAEYLGLELGPKKGETRPK